MRLRSLSRRTWNSWFHVSRTERVTCSRRHYSATPLPSVHCVEVPVGANGTVVIEVLPPLTPPPPESRPSLLIYLPSGPFFPPEAAQSPAAAHHSSTPHLLSTLLPTTPIITIRYRLATPAQPFPLPIHDVFLAFDHIRNFLAPTLHPQLATTIKPWVGLYGSHVGGSLALSLALSEPDVIDAISVSCPIANWVDFEDSDVLTSPSSTRKTKASSRTSKKTSNIGPEHLTSAAKHLRLLRKSLFPKPETYFDPFASPALFLRDAGRDCPPDRGALDNRIDVYNGSYAAYGPYDDDHSTSPSTSSASTSDSETSISTSSNKTRKTLKRWPSAPRKTSTRLSGQKVEDNEIIVPWTRILLPAPKSLTVSSTRGINAILRNQGYEMGDLMRRACFWGRDKSEAATRIGIEDVDVDGDIAEAAENMTLGQGGGFESRSERAMAKRAGEWIRERLDRDSTTEE